ncbi:MAG: type II secretion system protein GspL [Gammaproteobacteria bacterium]|nr:type II secretion system protein GspL [Gammaproteobacteria bacterium]
MRLLIQFTDDELADFRWANFDEVDGSAALDWQLAGEGELPVIASQNPHPVIIVIPQQCVYLTSIELPEKAGRQVLAAIEYQVEDQLAQDIESQHFALGDTSQNPVSIAVVSRAIMGRCLALAQGHGLRLSRIIPEIFLCPWPGEGVSLSEGHDGCLLRYGTYRGLKCHAQALPAMLELVTRDVEIDRIRFYGATDEAAPELDGYEVERYALASVKPGFVDAPVIDLQQRDYQLSSVWRGLAKTWKWVGLLIVALLAIGAYNKAVALQELEDELAGIRQQQYELLKSFLPQGTSANDNLKKLLIERMRQLQASEREQGFLKLLLDFTNARSNYPDVEITRIGFQGRQLSFDISSAQLKSIEALLESVRKLGVSARLESLNIKPEKSSGRLVLEGGSDA